jgi:hypothetical protein
MSKLAAPVLTQGYFVTSYEATSTGYYQVVLGSEKDGTSRMVTVEQSGQGGSNVYHYEVSTDHGRNWVGDSPTHFEAWLAEQIPFAAATMRELDFDDLAVLAEERSMEWPDIVVMAICDGVEMRRIPVAK